MPSSLMFSSPIANPAIIQIKGVDEVLLASILDPFADEPKLETQIPLGFSALQQLMLTWHHVRKLPPQGFKNNQITWGEF